jgi:hypothetical protein
MNPFLVIVLFFAFHFAEAKSVFIVPPELLDLTIEDVSEAITTSSTNASGSTTVASSMTASSSTVAAAHSAVTTTNSTTDATISFQPPHFRQSNSVPGSKEPSMDLVSRHFAFQTYGSVGAICLAIIIVVVCVAVVAVIVTAVYFQRQLLPVAAVAQQLQVAVEAVAAAGAAAGVGAVAPVTARQQQAHEDIMKVVNPTFTNMFGGTGSHGRSLLINDDSVVNEFEKLPFVNCNTNRNVDKNANAAGRTGDQDCEYCDEKGFLRVASHYPFCPERPVNDSTKRHQKHSNLI